MDDSYFTSVYMSHAILNAWLRDASSPTAEPRHLIFTASFLSFFPVTGYASYSPSKAALRCLSDTLSQEMNLYANTPTNVRVHTVFPATIFTESFEEEQKVKADVTKMIEEGDEGQTPDEVARLCIEGLERGEELVTTTFLTRIAMAGMLGGSLRNGWALLDTLLSWLMSIVTVFIRLDLDRKVRRWGRENGSSGMKKQK